MEMKILNEKKNPFLKRQELVVEVSSDVTPTIADFESEYQKGENAIVVRRVNASFGKHAFTAEVLVYDSVADRKEVEMVPKKIREKLAAEEKARLEAEAKAKAEAEAAAKAAEEAAKAEAEAPVEENAEAAPEDAAEESA